MTKNENIQVVRPIDKNDKIVIQAKQITKQFRVLPYDKVDKLLDERATNFALSKKAQA